jgi:hypothetical protein
MKYKGEIHLKALGVHGRRTIRWIVQKQDKTLWTRFMWPKRVVGFFNHSYVHASSKKCGRFID